MIPKASEVETDGSAGETGAFCGGVEKPLRGLLDADGGIRAPVGERLQGDGGFFDGGGGVFVAAEGAVGFLRGLEVMEA